MAYPPALPPGGRTNDSPATTHADDHNKAAAALADILTELGTNPSGTAATVEARIAAIPAGATGPAGPIGATGATGPQGPAGTTPTLATVATSGKYDDLVNLLVLAPGAALPAGLAAGTLILRKQA